MKLIFGAISLVLGFISAGFFATHFQSSIFGNYFAFQLLLFVITFFVSFPTLLIKGVGKKSIVMAMIGLVLSLLPLAALFIRPLILGL